MKVCTKCGVSKELSLFHKDKTHADGHRSFCKECVKNYTTKYYQDNKDAVYARVYSWIENNRKRHNEKCKKWVAGNRGKVNARTARRYAAKTQATPSWLGPDEHWLIAEAYDLAQLRTKTFGFPWEVDHVVPLRGTRAMGLHVPWNLQVIPQTVNRRKSKTFDPVAS